MNKMRSTNENNVFSTRMQNCRRKLQDKFEQTAPAQGKKNKNNERNVLSVLTINDTRRYLRAGANKISKTFNTVRTTFDTLTQKFKAVTRRREILQEGPITPKCDTPQTFSRAILGRTPTKLYSPFNIESPFNKRY